jgi:class 3 adenylate cyclase
MLGDGMMLVWEVPSSLNLSQQSDLSDTIINIVDRFRGRFLFHFRNLDPVERDSFSEEVLKIDLGFGIAKGHAWKLDYGASIDYAGSVINLAARLQTHARPGGRVVQLEVAPWYLTRNASHGDGRLVEIRELRGLTGKTMAWIDDTVAINQPEFVPTAPQLNSADVERLATEPPATPPATPKLPSP